MKKFFRTVLLILISMAAGAFLYARYGSALHLSEKMESISFADIGELATQEADLTMQGTIEKDKLKDKTGWDIPFVGSKVVYSYDVVIKAGYDFADITADIDSENQTVTVHLPQAEILSDEIDQNSIQVYDSYNSVFNRVTMEDISTSEEELKKKAEEKAEANGLYEKAEQNAEVLLKDKIASAGYEDYTVTFEQA